MWQYCKRIGFFWLWVLKQFIQDQCLIRASGLTFTSLLALVPLLVVVFSIIRALPVFDKLTDQIQGFIFNNFVPHSGTIIQKYIIGFETQASQLPLLGFAFLIVTALLMMVNIEKNLNDILAIRYQRHFTGSLLLYWAMLTLGPLLIGVSIVMSSYLASFHWLHGFGLDGARKLLFLLPLLAEFLAMAFLYLVVPHGAIKLKHAAVGALVATILFECAKHLFSFYINHFPTYELLYGALATIPIFLLWLYLCWIIFLFGAEVVNGLRYQRASRSQHDAPLFLIAYRLLGHLYQAHKHGDRTDLMRLLDLESDFSVVSVRKVLSALQDHKWISGARGVYVLTCDLHDKTLEDLISDLKYYVPFEQQFYTQSNWDQSLFSLLATVRQSQHLHFKQTLSGLFDQTVVGV